MFEKTRKFVKSEATITRDHIQSNKGPFIFLAVALFLIWNVKLPDGDMPEGYWDNFEADGQANHEAEMKMLGMDADDPYWQSLYSQDEEQPYRSKPIPFVKQNGKTGYLVREGDTLYAISKRTGVPLAKLKAANGGSDEIHTGQRLITK